MYILSISLLNKWTWCSEKLFLMDEKERTFFQEWEFECKCKCKWY